MAIVKQQTTSVGEDVEIGNPSALLVEMQTGAATVENSMEFPQKTTKLNCLLTWQFHWWNYSLRILKHQFKRINASLYSEQHNLQ